MKKTYTAPTTDIIRFTEEEIRTDVIDVSNTGNNVAGVDGPDMF